MLVSLFALISACAHQATHPNPTTPVTVAAAGRSYVDAVRTGNLDALVNAFTEDAVIVDVGRQIKGHDGIRAWAQNEVMGGQLDVLGRTDLPSGEDLLVRFNPPGWGGAFDAHYRFTYRDGRISRADLTYA
jgi:hypothetical protein